MAPHLSAEELDFIQAKEQAGKTPVQIHQMLATRRARRKIAAPDLTNLRRAMKGLTYKRGRKETRGRKLKYSKTWVPALNKVRKDLLKKTRSEREVRWSDVLRKARAPKATASMWLRDGRGRSHSGLRST